MSYTCRNCGTTIMEDDENLCSKCKPAESAPAARDEGWSMASIHRELSEAAERSRPVTLSAAEARTVLDTLAAEGRRRGGGEMSDNWHGWINGVEFTSRESALKALGISEPAPADEKVLMEAEDKIDRLCNTLAEAERNNTIAWEAVHKIANHSIGQLAARIDAENMRDLARSAREKAALLAHEAPKEQA